MNREPLHDKFVIRIPDPAGQVPLGKAERRETRVDRVERSRRVGLATTDGWGVFFAILIALPYSLFCVLAWAQTWIGLAMLPAVVWVVWRVRRAGRRQ